MMSGIFLGNPNGVLAKWGSENLSQNRIYRCSPLRVMDCGLFFATHRVVNVVMVPNAMIDE